MLQHIITYYLCSMNAFEEAGTSTRENFFSDELLTVSHTYNLIVWNDSQNTFEWVIETLVEVCKHSVEQAEQCAYIIHFQGKYAVKQGEFEALKPMQEAITERGINATIEEMVEN